MINLTYAKRYCKEYRLIENYDQAMADESQTWCCHHRREIDWNMTPKELIAIGRYYNVHYSELIFLTPAEHNRLHHTGKEGGFKGKHHTEEHKAKMSTVMKGENNPMCGFHRFGENAPNYKYHITADELYDLYIVRGFTLKQIAEMYRCKPETIFYKLKKFNIKKNKN